MIIKNAQPEYSAAWERMRQSLSPSSPGEHAAEIAGFFRGNRNNPAEVLIVLNETGDAIDFADLSIRSFARVAIPGALRTLKVASSIPTREEKESLHW